MIVSINPLHFHFVVAVFILVVVVVVFIIQTNAFPNTFDRMDPMIHSIWNGSGGTSLMVTPSLIVARRGFDSPGFHRSIIIMIIDRNGLRSSTTRNPCRSYSGTVGRNVSK